ncbi:unnamed protein product [Caenorhabditis angaria]|uniref:Uncharacterized protein n=1 Tax=Caenorhabditis angaria TaxID=860376 RepID=A0A9P1IP07_9PELO|nr:unnamed protein product [Caenorhabditis angaria]
MTDQQSFSTKLVLQALSNALLILGFVASHLANWEYQIIIKSSPVHIPFKYTKNIMLLMLPVYFSIAFFGNFTALVPKTKNLIILGVLCLNAFGFIAYSSVILEYQLYRRNAADGVSCILILLGFVAANQAHREYQISLQSYQINTYYYKLNSMVLLIPCIFTIGFFGLLNAHFQETVFSIFAVIYSFYALLMLIFSSMHLSDEWDKWQMARKTQWSLSEFEWFVDLESMFFMNVVIIFFAMLLILAVGVTSSTILVRRLIAWRDSGSKSDNAEMSAETTTTTTTTQTQTTVTR